MSFSSEVKEELSKQINFKDKNVLKAELLGYMLTSNTNLDENEIEFVTENEFNIETLYKILFNLEKEYEPSVKGKCFVATLKLDNDIKEYLDLITSDKDNILKAIVKGAFLGAGSINEPENNYHLEINFQTQEYANYILNICKKFGINLKIINTKSKFMLYIKESEEISKFLALIGANISVLKLEDIRILREMKNNVNRIVNCETANLNKTVNAAVDQINDIKFIQKCNKFEELPEELKIIALARIENPDITLKELGAMLNEPIGKSGAKHRMERIHEWAEDLRKNNIRMNKIFLE